jgi:hypothetical protein
MLRRDILEALANFPNAGLWGHTGPKTCVRDLLQHGLFNELQMLPRMLVMATFYYKQTCIFTYHVGHTTLSTAGQ